MAQKFWEQFNQGLEMGNKIWTADSNRRLKGELAAAGKLTPEQQTLGVNAPTQPGQVPQGYEDHMMVDTQTGRFIPTADANVDPELHAQQGLMAESFNQPGAFQGAKTSYSLGGVSQDKAFNPDEIQNARRQAMADVYTKYGEVDKADELRMRGMQAEAAGLTLKKQKSDIAKEEAFETDRAKAFNESSAALNAATRAKKLLDEGNSADAARELISFRSGGIGDNRMLRINADDLIEGSEDGGATWKQAPGDTNIHNPQVVEKMLSGINATMDKRLDELLAKHADKKDLFAMRSQIKDEAFKKYTLETTIAQANKELQQKQDQFEKGLISAEQLQNAKIKAEKDLADAHNRTAIRAAGISASRSAYPSMSLQGTLKDGTPVYFDAHGGGMFTAGGKKLNDTEAKDVSLTTKASGKPGLDLEAAALEKYKSGNLSYPEYIAEVQSIRINNLEANAGANIQDKPNPNANPNVGLQSVVPGAYPEYNAPAVVKKSIFPNLSSLPNSSGLQR